MSTLDECQPQTILFHFFEATIYISIINEMTIVMAIYQL